MVSVAGFDGLTDHPAAAVCMATDLHKMPQAAVHLADSPLISSAAVGSSSTNWHEASIQVKAMAVLAPNLHQHAQTVPKLDNSLIRARTDPADSFPVPTTPAGLVPM